MIKFSCCKVPPLKPVWVSVKPTAGQQFPTSWESADNSLLSCPLSGHLAAVTLWSASALLKLHLETLDEYRRKGAEI